MSSEVQTRVRRRSGYTSVPNAVMGDVSLSIEARGMLGLLMTFSEGWVFRVTHIQKQCGVGREKYYRMVNELKKAGYLKITKSKGDAGKFAGADWEIIDVPEASPCAGNPTSADPTVRKPDHIRENNSVRENNIKNPHTPKGDDLFSGNLEEAEPQADVTAELIDAGFNDWWDVIWPQHHRKAGRKSCYELYRKTCLGKYAKADQITPATLNRATKAYIASVKDPEQYLKAPLPWLRKPGWEPFVGAPAEPELSEEQLRYRRIAEEARSGGRR